MPFFPDLSQTAHGVCLLHCQLGCEHRLFSVDSAAGFFHTAKWRFCRVF